VHDKIVRIDQQRLWPRPAQVGLRVHLLEALNRMPKRAICGEAERCDDGALQLGACDPGVAQRTYDLGKRARCIRVGG
jgi:hypothetical protein